jgi:tripartite-type tricarboxylate transporter receptor subunit TctC
MLTRRHLIVTAALACAALATFTPFTPFTNFTNVAQAQTTTDKTVKLIVGFPPGGSVDTVARLLAEQLRGTYSPTVIVENRAGAGGRIGAQAVKTGDADGTLILITPASILTIYPHVYKKLGYDSLADFTPVSSVATVTFALSVSSAVPASVKTLADYIAWAKANPKEANYGSPAAGATPHFVGVMLGRAGGVPLNHIPFKGGAPLVSDLLGGQVQSGVNVLPEVLQHHLSGKLRILAVSGTKRSKFLPSVPTMAESGFKDVAADEYFGVFVPAKTPPDVVSKLNAAIRAALKTKPVMDGLEKASFELGGESQAEFGKVIKSELGRWGPVVKASGFASEE